MEKFDQKEKLLVRLGLSFDDLMNDGSNSNIRASVAQTKVTAPKQTHYPEALTINIFHTQR